MTGLMLLMCGASCLLRSPDDTDTPGGPGESPESGPDPALDAPISGGPAQPGRVLEQDIQRELKDSYLTYAMSTIMDRALPDVRDGMKPSQRRILWAMNDLNLRPGRKHIKCAKICGDTSGNYHPHGEGVIYPTLVGMAQKWRMSVPLVDPQGNFGSIEGDPPAAMRYTEARMMQAAVDMMADVDLDTVEMQPNYDDRLMEPTVLPGKFPNLLINGGVGIAVGMATSLAPQNPTEVFDAMARVVEARLSDRADPGVDELMRDQLAPDGTILRRGIQGPDFPTGGIAHGKRGIIEAYLTGRGKVTVRGTCHVEDLAKDRKQLVIDSIPYMLNQSSLVEKIVDAVKDEHVTDVSDVRNESGREASTRVVIELRKGGDPAVVEKQLYEFTPLQQTFSIINLALVNRQPRTLSLPEMISCYIEHRTDVIRRRTAHLLREAKKRAHVLEGMIYAVCDIDEVIREIRASSTREEAIERLMARQFRIPASHPYASQLPRRLIDRVVAAERVGGIELTRVQAETIGAMRLIQLVGLEIEKLAAEYAGVVGEIEGYEAILADTRKVLQIIAADLEELKARHGRPRRTLVEDAGADVSIADLIPVTDVAVTISHAGYIKRVPLETYRQQSRGGKGIRAGESRDDDFIEHVFVASTHDDLLCFTNTGRVFKMKVFEIPEMSRTSLGRAIVNLIEMKPGERTCAYLAIKNFEQKSNFLTFVSRDGIVKRTPLKAYANVGRAGLIAVGLKEGDSLLDVCLTSGSDDLLLATANGMSIRFFETGARDMGRAAAGVKGIELEEGDRVIGAVVVPMTLIPSNAQSQPVGESDEELTVTTDPSLCLLTITERGLGKRTPIDEYRVQPESGKLRSQSRGGKGRVDIKITDKGGPGVAALLVRSTDDVVVVSKGGQLVRMPAAEIRECGRGSQGVRVASLNEGDRVVAAARVEGLDGGTVSGSGRPEAGAPEGSVDAPGPTDTPDGSPGSAPSDASGANPDRGEPA